MRWVEVLKYLFYRLFTYRYELPNDALLTDGESDVELQVRLTVRDEPRNEWYEGLFGPVQARIYL